jgi:hypothetical protein
MVREGRCNDKLPASRLGAQVSVSSQFSFPSILVLRSFFRRSFFRSAFRLLKEHGRHNFSHPSLSSRRGISWRNVRAIFLERTPLIRRPNSEHAVAGMKGSYAFAPSTAWHDRNSPPITLRKASVQKAGVPRYFDVPRDSSYYQVIQARVGTGSAKGRGRYRTDDFSYTNLLGRSCFTERDAAGTANVYEKPGNKCGTRASSERLQFD